MLAQIHRATAASSPQRGHVLASVACMRAAAHFTTVTPIDLAVPMIDVQMDSRGMNSLPGSDCLTCARSGVRARGGARQRAGAPLQSRTRASAKWSPSACVPVSGFPTGCLRRAHVQTRAARGGASSNAPAAFLIKYVAGGFFTTCRDAQTEPGQDTRQEHSSATDATHKLEALVLVRGHQYRQRNILLARHEARGATS